MCAIASASSGHSVVNDGLAEEQLGVIRIEGEPLGADGDCAVQVTEHLMATSDQGEELSRDGVGRGGSGETLVQAVERRSPVLPLDRDRSQIKENEWVLWALGKFCLQDPRVTLKLAFPERGIGVARVPDRDVRPPNGNTRPPQSR
jgi:hypothetical protein